MAVRIHGSFGSWVLPSGESILGRGPSCGICIDDARLSRKHARFIVDGHKVLVVDLGSTNGVLVNGAKIDAPCELQHGSIVVCGPATLTVAMDQTAPHPRIAEGIQDPTTRRGNDAEQTLAMSEHETALDRPVAGGRGIDKGIACAVGSAQVAAPLAVYDPKVSAFQPAEAPSSISSPLAAGRPAPGGAGGGTLRKHSPATTTGLEAMDIPGGSTGALDPPRLVPSTFDRLAAGLVDGLIAGLATIPGLMIVVLSYGEALSIAGARVVSDVPQFSPGASAGLFELAATLGTGPGLVAAFDAAAIAANSSLAAMGVLIGGTALGALVVAVALLIVLVVPTTLRGAPWFHRTRGLHLVRSSGYTRLTWSRACARWGLAIMLWPLALPSILLRSRSLHDCLSGCSLQHSQHTD